MQPVPWSVHLTRHAGLRASQRGVSIEAIDAALAWGREIHVGGGVLECRLDRRSVAQARRTGVDLKAFEGTIVIVSVRDGRVVTAYRNRHPRRVRR